MLILLTILYLLLITVLVVLLIEHKTCIKQAKTIRHLEENVQALEGTSGFNRSMSVEDWAVKQLEIAMDKDVSSQRTYIPKYVDPVEQQMQVTAVYIFTSKDEAKDWAINNLEPVKDKENQK